MATDIAKILERLEAFHGPQKPWWPTEPYSFLIWWYCGYPASDAACSKGWESLNRTIGIDPQRILDAPTKKLSQALAPGGMVPERRAQRLREIASRVINEFGGTLELTGPIPKIRKTLKSFPSIADPGADRILLFAGIEPVAAVPSNCPHALYRILRGAERENYGVTYREAQQAIEAGVPKNFEARKRAFMLVKRHGQEICKTTKPQCDACPVNSMCVYAARERDKFLATK
jgi:endonuclease III